MSRPPLPRFVGDVIVTIELPGTDEADALTALDDLVEGYLRHSLEARVRNAGSRTARLTGVTIPSDPDGMARQ